VTKGQSQLTEIRESLGANLVLASSAIFQGKQVQLILKVLDAAADRVLRRKVVICGLHEMAMLPAKAVRVAAEILEVSRFVDDNGRLQPGTQSAAAYQAFQAAEVFRKQPNDTGLDSAIEQYKIAVERDEHYAAAHARLAMAYCRQYWLRRNEPAALDLAQANANTALDLDKNSGDAHLALGLVQQYRGRKDEALAEMGKALEIDPANPRTLVWQGFVYCDMNQLGKAEEMFRRVLKARPNYWLAYSELGVVFETGGKYLEALQAYRSASLAQPKNALALNNIGSVLRKLGRLPEARESLQRSLALKPIAWAAANMAEVLRAQGRNAAALPFGLKAVELDPADEQNWLELGECYSALPNYRRQAREAYLRAAKGAEQHLQMDESDGPGWMRLALCQAKTGPPAAALATARKAESLGASELDSQIFKAQILELAAQRGGALAVLADCFRQGATKFQIGSIADLQSLRADSRYLAISNTAHAPASVAPPH
jgi:tetratricopeptide (TPR) repeat protein